MDNNESKNIKENIIKVLIDNINSSNEEDITKEICNNIIDQNISNCNEEEKNNIINYIFENEDSVSKQKIIEKLSLLNENKQYNNANNNNIDNNDNEEINIHINEEEIIQPSNNIKMPVINIKPREHKNRNNSNTNEIKKELKKNEKKQNEKKVLAADKISINKIEPSSKNKIFEQINNFKNEFFSPKNPLPSISLPYNKKPVFLNDKSVKNATIKKKKIDLKIKNYNINDENQRKEYVNDIKGKLKNFANEKKERENKEKDLKSPFDDINDMIEKLQNKKKEN